MRAGWSHGALATARDLDDGFFTLADGLFTLVDDLLAASSRAVCIEPHAHTPRCDGFCCVSNGMLIELTEAGLTPATPVASKTAA